MMRWLLLAAAVAPLILIWIVIRDHELSWPRGEMTAVVGDRRLRLVVYVGFIDRPGEPPARSASASAGSSALLGTILMMVGGAIRAGETERNRKPPGVL